MKDKIDLYVDHLEKIQERAKDKDKLEQFKKLEELRFLNSQLHDTYAELIEYLQMKNEKLENEINELKNKKEQNPIGVSKGEKEALDYIKQKSNNWEKDFLDPKYVAKFFNDFPILKYFKYQERLEIVKFGYVESLRRNLIEILLCGKELEELVDSVIELFDNKKENK